MHTDAIQNYREARANLLEEKQTLEQKLEEINRLLAGNDEPKFIPPVLGHKTVTNGHIMRNGRKVKKANPFRGNEKTLPERLQEFLRSGRKNVHELLDDVENVGHQINSRKKIDVVRAALYNKRNQRRFGFVSHGEGVFSLK